MPSRQHIFIFQAILAIYIIPVTKVNQDQSHSMIQEVLDKTELYKALCQSVWSCRSWQNIHDILWLLSAPCLAKGPPPKKMLSSPQVACPTMSPRMSLQMPWLPSSRYRWIQGGQGVGPSIPSKRRMQRNVRLGAQYGYIFIVDLSAVFKTFWNPDKKLL